MPVLSSLAMGQLLEQRFEELDDRDEAVAAKLAALLDGSRAYFEGRGRLELKAAFDEACSGTLSGRKGRLASDKCCGLAEDLLAKTVESTKDTGWISQPPTKTSWAHLLDLCEAQDSSVLDLPTCANLCLCVVHYAIHKHVVGLLEESGIKNVEILSDRLLES